MNILCVGNSFAVDAATYMHQIALSAGRDIEIAVLYIPGCPIDLHYKNFLSGDKAYEFYVNGERTPRMYCSIHEGLAYKKWDFITFQQRSGDSVDANTFFPELTLLSEAIRKGTDARFLLHKTWSYARTFPHSKYKDDPLMQEKMTADIEAAYLEASKRSGIDHIIPSGTAITNARKQFGDVLNRDGYHLNETARTLVGIVWTYYFLGTEINIDNFEPSGYTYDDVTGPVSREVYAELLKIAQNTILENRGFNL